MTWAMDADVSIIVPLACDAERALRCLQAIAAQPAEPAYDVIVVADAAPWLEPLLAQLEGDVTVVRTERPLGATAALGAALGHVEADTVAVLADAAVPAPGWLSPLLALLRNPATGTAYSPGPDGSSPLRSLAAAWRTADVRAIADTLPAADPPVPALALSLAGRGLTAAAGPIGAVAPAGPPTGRHAPRTEPELTVVIPTLDATSERIRRCLTAVRACTDAPHQVVVVDNGAPAQGFSDPVNAGLRATASPYVVVMNDDVEVLPGWWEPLRASLHAGAAVSFPLTVDGAMRTDFAAWCFAASRDTLERFSHAYGAFFDPSLVIWFQDTDLLVRLTEEGLPPQLVRESHIRHGLSQTLSDPDPVLSTWVKRQVAVDQERFALKHPLVRLTPA
jgi:GT2 family glycosyltransferase